MGIGMVVSMLGVLAAPRMRVIICDPVEERSKGKKKNV